MGLEPTAPLWQQRILEHSSGRGLADSLATHASFAQSEMCGQQRGCLQHGDSVVSLRGPLCLACELPAPGCTISSNTQAQPLTCSLAPNCSSSFLSRLASISSICTCPAGSRGAAALASTSADARPATKRSSRAVSTCCSPAAGADNTRSCKADAGSSAVWGACTQQIGPGGHEAADITSCFRTKVLPNRFVSL